MTNSHCVFAAKKRQARVESVGNGGTGQSQYAPECSAFWHLDLGRGMDRTVSVWRISTGCVGLQWNTISQVTELVILEN